MSRRDRKYNIWIAYSDLFMNLSTFLFISALGVFAAFGSGLLAPPGGGGSETCSIPTRIRESMEGSDSAWHKAGSGTRPRGVRDGCTEYFVISGFHFRSRDPLSFVNRDGRTPTGADLRSICVPIWRAVMQSEFAQAGGQVTFLGIAEADIDLPYPPSCGRPPDDGYIEGFPGDIRRSETILRCQAARLPGGKAYPICPEVLACLSSAPRDRRSWCRSVVAVRDRYLRWLANCARNGALPQANHLYAHCEQISGTRGFPDNDFDEPQFVPNAEERETRQLSWRSVDFAAVARDGLSRDYPADHPLSTQPAGSVLVQVQYGR